MNKIICFTFDDGFYTHFTKTRQLFKDYNIQGTHYVIVEKIGSSSVPPFQRSMNWTELKILQSEGWEISSHGLEHKPMSKLTPEEAELELTTSKNILLAHRINPVGFAYPYGDAGNYRNLVLKYYAYARATNDIVIPFKWNLNLIPCISLDTWSFECIRPYLTHSTLSPILVFRAHRPNGYIEEIIEEIIVFAQQYNTKIMPLCEALKTQGLIQ